MSHGAGAADDAESAASRAEAPTGTMAKGRGKGGASMTGTAAPALLLGATEAPVAPWRAPPFLACLGLIPAAAVLQGPPFAPPRIAAYIA